MTRQQEFRKQTEEAKLEAFSLMCRKVAELEKENAELKKKCYKKAVKDYCELEKENAELKCECRRCVYSDCPCILSDYGKDRNGICDHFKDVFDEIVELKEKVNILDNCDRLGDVITETYKDQLTKAKELLERLLITSCNSDVLNLLPNCSEVLRVRVEAEQFLSEVEK